MTQDSIEFIRTTGQYTENSTGNRTIEVVYTRHNGYQAEIILEIAFSADRISEISLPHREGFVTITLTHDTCSQRSIELTEKFLESYNNALADAINARRSVECNFPYEHFVKLLAGRE